MDESRGTHVARRRSTSKKGTGRGSAEAIAKRRAARQLNQLFTEGGGAGRALDGRTEKRRRRLLEELKKGRKGTPLKAIEILSHTQELLELGETLSSIKRTGVKPLKVTLGDADMAIVHATQKEYGFRDEAWRMLGLSLKQPKAAGAPKAAKRGKRPRKKA
jgi:hypothetical protein